MNAVIYAATGVRKPAVSPAALEDLSGTWEVVRSAAVDCQTQVNGAIASVLVSNQGEATDAFKSYAHHSDSPKAQLGRLADAASATRDAHAQAAGLIRRVNTDMDAVAAAAARDLIDARMLVPFLRERHVAAVVGHARQVLLAIRDGAVPEATAIYESVNMPGILSMTEEQGRGSVPPAIQEAWEEMDPATRRQLLDAVAEDVMAGWSDDVDRPRVIFYSNQVDLPDGTERPPSRGGDDWSGYNGVAMGGDIYINYDIMESNDFPVQLSTVVHELQHIEQGHMREQYNQMVAADPGVIDDIRAGRAPDPFQARGSSIDEVERFRVPYESARVDGGRNPYYQNQYLEIDARRAGTEYLDSLTPEQIEVLLG